MKPIAFFLSLFVSLMVWGQGNTYTFIEYDTISNGYIEMTLDKRMDELLEAKKDRCDVVASWQNQTAKMTKEEKKVTVVDMCREHPKMRGFRIQVLNTRSSEEAEKAKEQIQRQFPHLSSSVELRRPQFKVLMGDYFSKANAAKDLDAVKKVHPGALLVASKIWCNRAQ